MPFYEYICKNCEQLFEKYYPSAAEADGRDLPACPHCGHTEVVRILSAFWGASGGEDSCGTGKTSFG
jgi:putative FmdB family regulatory protein